MDALTLTPGEFLYRQLYELKTYYQDRKLDGGRESAAYTRDVLPSDAWDYIIREIGGYKI